MEKKTCLKLAETPLLVFSLLLTQEINYRFTRSLQVFPRSLDSADGSLCKTVKSKLLYRFFAIHVGDIGTNFCNAPPVLHAFTSSDPTSWFAGKVKKTALKLCKVDPVTCEGMATLGHSFDAETVPFSNCQGFVCMIYGKPKPVEVNECQFITFCGKLGQL